MNQLYGVRRFFAFFVRRFVRTKWQKSGGVMLSALEQRLRKGLCRFAHSFFLALAHLWVFWPHFFGFVRRIERAFLPGNVVAAGFMSRCSYIGPAIQWPRIAPELAGPERDDAGNGGRRVNLFYE